MEVLNLDLIIQISKNNDAEKLQEDHKVRCNMAHLMVQTVCVLVGSSSAHECKILKSLCKSTLKLQQLNSDFYTIKYFQICNVNYVKLCAPLLLKVSKFPNEFMKSSFLPKYERNIVKISALQCGTVQGRNPYNISFIFWEKR